MNASHDRGELLPDAVMLIGLFPKSSGICPSGIASSQQHYDLSTTLRVSNSNHARMSNRYAYLTTDRMILVENGDIISRSTRIIDHNAILVLMLIV